MRLTLSCSQKAKSYISIHASLARCVGIVSNPRYSTIISIHASLARCVKFRYVTILLQAISIHASLARCVRADGSRRAVQEYFNPRISCEMRLCMVYLFYSPRSFQSTHLLRDASIRQFHTYQQGIISIHASLARCVARDKIIKEVKQIISIHASLARCVRGRIFRLSSTSLFQSTHLLRDASVKKSLARYARAIFQSTHLLRDASLHNGGCVLAIIISIHASLARCVCA